MQKGKTPEKKAENLVGAAENRLSQLLAMSQGQTLKSVNEALGTHYQRMADYLTI